METSEEPEGAQKGVLDDVLGVMVVARQPAGQIVCSIQVRHNQLLETCLSILFFHSFFPPGKFTVILTKTRFATVLFPSRKKFYCGNILEGWPVGIDERP